MNRRRYITKQEFISFLEREKGYQNILILKKDLDLSVAQYQINMLKNQIKNLTNEKQAENKTVSDNLETLKAQISYLNDLILSKMQEIEIRDKALTEINNLLDGILE